MSAMTREVKCECGHSVTRHGPRGCSAYVLPRIDGSQTCCSRSPSDIVAAREAAAREAVLAEVEALAERMLACVGCYDEAFQDCPRHGESAAGFYIPQAADEMFALARRLRADA